MLPRRDRYDDRFDLASMQHELRSPLAGDTLLDEILRFAPFLRQGRQNDGRKTRRARSFI